MKWIFIFLGLLGAVVALMYLFPQINYRNMPDGILNGKLDEKKPNWVSSFVAKNEEHYIAPLKINSLAQLSSCIRDKLPEVRIKKLDEKELIAYRASTVFHFVDWFCIHADGQVVSSATMGYSDLGKNRELIESIRTFCQ